MNAVTIYPLREPLHAWRWLGDNLADAPMWVRIKCQQRGDELLHERRSGAQIVYRGEYLVRDLDGAVNFYTPDEYARGFQK